MGVDAILDPVLRPLLSFGSFWSVFILAAVITLFATIVQKYTTNQEKLKKIKAKQKEMQKELKKHAKDPKKMQKIRSEMMANNAPMMKESFKPLLYTFLPIIIIFGWMQANLAYESLEPGVPFEVRAQFSDLATGQVTLESDSALEIITPTKEIEELVGWKVKGEAGEHNLFIKYGDEEENIKVLIGGPGYLPPAKEFEDKDLQVLAIEHKKVHPFGSFKIFGWQPGWFGTYFIISIALSLLLRKLLKVA